ncbi:MAG: TlpA family protein disulfide reductase [Chromatiaceae bacterium]|nr:TlpA family protein disulfide reductase [Chromatiaceae bacterium]
MSVVPTETHRFRGPLLLGLVLAAVGMLLCTGSALSAELPPLSNRVTLLEEPQPAPPLRLIDLDEVEQDLANLRGRLVLANFWATWCPPCRREMPSMERLHQALKDQGLTVLAVDVGEDLDTIFAFTGQLEPAPTFPLLADLDGSTAEAWGVLGLPTSFVVDPEGQIVMRAVGGTEFDDPALIERLKRYLPELTPSAAEQP